MTRLRRFLPDIAIIALLFVLPLIVFWLQTVGGMTLLPAENLYQYEPYASFAAEQGAPLPHNALLSDLVLQNMQWKAFIRSQLAQGEIPLWNPHQFGGIPFMAAGQASTLYPLSIIYYVLDLPAAYGWFTVVNLWLAGVFMLLFMRGLGIGRSGATLAGVVYQLSAFLLTSAVFPMIIGAAVWLPLLLLMTEFIIRRQPFMRGQSTVIPWVAIGAVALAFNIYAGHVELTIYTLLITAYYAAFRLAAIGWRISRGRTRYGRTGSSPLQAMPLRTGLWLVGMVAVGFAIGALQFLPLFELVTTNWRSGSADFQTVLGWAHPIRDVVQYVMPNFYGNPAHHSYFDWFTMQTVTDFTNAAGQSIRTIDWGIKNYVEGALYLGILPLVLAIYGLFARHHVTDSDEAADLPPYRALFASLGVIALTFMFGAPTYILIYILPGLNQSHTPFRWVYAVTLCVAVLAGFGMDALDPLRRLRATSPVDEGGKETPSESLRDKLARRFGIGLIGAGIVILGGLFLSRIFYPQIEALVDRIFRGMAEAERAFSSAGMFYSYQFTNVLMFGVFVLLAGVAFLLIRRTKWGVWLAIGIVAVDLMVASWGFNPASDPALLDFTPPAIQWLQDNSEGWRYTVLDDPTQPIPDMMNANMGWRYGLDDIRGYDSIISGDYVAFMGMLAPQVQLDHNRIAPFYTAYPDTIDYDYREGLRSPLLDLLNVRYIVTHTTTDIDLPMYRLVYDEEVRIWENMDAMPRAYTVATDHLDTESLTVPSVYVEATITRDTGRELFIDTHAEGPSWLIVSQTYYPGWRAFLRPQGAGEDAETPLDVQRVQFNFQGITLPQSGDYTVRLVYSPASFQIGLFGSIMGVAIITLMIGMWLWRAFVGVNTEESSTASRVARNSIAPIILNLFNRGIDFAFALVMLRILGPEDAGIYYYAVFIFVWFDIFTNFGLDLFLIREASRHKDNAGHYFYNTTFLRLILSVAGIGLLVGFLAIRQATVEPALSSEALLAIGLLYIGLFPGSLSKGMTSLFYAYEKAEYPAAIATITSINKAVFGVIALILGYGIVGLAAVSIINNLLTFVVLVYTGRALIGHIAQKRPDVGLIRSMMGESWPLLVNHFLAHIFFQIDVLIIEPVRGALELGRYSVAYRWILAINIIPAFFTQALLPVMSRQAHEDRAAFKRNYQLGLKLLVALALPLAVFFTVTAEPLTFILGGAEYLPDGAIALQLMVWSIPIGWMNSLTQYALVALDLQRRIMRAFALAVVFNIVTNLIFIPQYGYRAAAITTIFSELMLFVPFAWLLHGAIGRVAWLDILWRPIVASGVMLAVYVVLSPIQPLLALIIAGGVYAVTILALRPLSADEAAVLAPLIPHRLKSLPLLKPALRV